MNEIIAIGVDIAKNVFQIHGVDAEGGTSGLQSVDGPAVPSLNLP